MKVTLINLTRLFNALKGFNFWSKSSALNSTVNLRIKVSRCFQTQFFNGNKIYMLFILTIERVLCKPFPGQNILLCRINMFSIFFPSQMEQDRFTTCFYDMWNSFKLSIVSLSNFHER